MGSSSISATLKSRTKTQMNELLPARTRFIIVLLRSLSYCSLSCMDILDSFFLLAGELGSFYTDLLVLLLGLPGTKSSSYSSYLTTGLTASLLMFQLAHSEPRSVSLMFSSWVGFPWVVDLGMCALSCCPHYQISWSWKTKDCSFSRFTR